MSGKLLTEAKLVELVEFVSEILDKERYQAMSVIARHAHSAGYAPAEPTDEQINEAIAKAQRWYWQGQKGSGFNEPSWFKDGHLISGGDNYQPAKNLGQALEAATALDVYVLVRTTTMPSHTAITVKFDDAPIANDYDSSTDAARAIATHLYERIKEQGSPEDEIEWRRR